MIHIHHHEDVTCLEGIVRVGDWESAIYVYVTDGMLVDTGPKVLEQALIHRFHEASFDSVVLTHSHEDHVGTASWIAQHKQVPLLIHEKGLDICSQKAQYPFYRKITWGIRDPFVAQPLGDVHHSRSLEWKVLYSPGHAHDHVALLDESTGRLFCGDLFMGVKTKVILREESIPTLMNSLRAVLTYDFQSIFCAHSGYHPDGKTRLQQKLEHLENLSGEILHLYSQGLSSQEINTRMFPSKPLIIAASTGEFDSLHIVTSVLAEHLPFPAPDSILEG
ncbi:MBL fold metallo-hydrolase [Brevibacillus fortis]|uniref:MBL fold metallo-hydrolase n=1 Tax=Brevibacillus fortis TaxID=2126352 RepID=A0A2P7V5R9_9BACL|nr:MBL fold metallo-hydrolase [Brevibacillus fortis]PSJ94562.1 MBL fold metallo-hydrolase [Brevibacillus fortis]